ncbi:MAG TPA: hypothetical protein VGF95_10485 [Solirubrobacteraceae bacterium]
MSSQEPTEEQLRAYEEELSRVTSTQIAIQAAASLLSIGGRRLGLAEGHEQERDLDQVRDAIDGVRALMPIIERRLAAVEVRQLREALSQLQMGYTRLVQAAPAADGAEQGASGQGAPSSAGPDAGQPGSGAAEQPASGAAEQPASGASGQAPKGDEQGRGPAETSGRLWVPGR